MQISRAVLLTSASPHKLFQELRRAVERDDRDDVQDLVKALLHALQGNQTIATSAIMELIDVALRCRCSLEIKKTLTRLPGFAVDAHIQWKGAPLIDCLRAQGDTEFAAYLTRQGASRCRILASRAQDGLLEDVHYEALEKS